MLRNYFHKEKAPEATTALALEIVRNYQIQR